MPCHASSSMARTDATSTAEQALEACQGVCQDHAHVFLSAARLMGVPARYVSGYLMMQDRVDQDATHAWAEVENRIREMQPDIVFAPHVETSAGVILPDDYLTRMADAAHEVGALMVLDCIASGCVWVDMAAILITLIPPWKLVWGTLWILINLAGLLAEMHSCA